MKFTRQWTAAEQQAYVDAVLEAARQAEARKKPGVVWKCADSTVVLDGEYQPDALEKYVRYLGHEFHRTVLDGLDGGRLVRRILNSH